MALSRGPSTRRRRPRAGGEEAGVRAFAAELVDDALASRAPIESALRRRGERFDERDRRLLAELVHGTLRWLRRLDHVLAMAASRPFDQIDAELRAPLRIAALQLLALDRIPAHAAVSEAVEEVRRRAGRGATGFTNAVLRQVARRPRWEDWPIAEADPVARLAIEGSHPERMVRRWWDRFGSERARSIVAAGNRERRLALLAFGDRGGREALASSLTAEDVETRPSVVSPVGLVVERGRPLSTRAFERGEFYVQDEASQAAALVPLPRSGEQVLDAAAAPGGKGLALLAAEPEARVVFADGSLARLRRLDENLSRLALRAPRVVADAAAGPWRETFDRVVLDAPCTGTGILCRHPELRWRFRVDELRRLADASVRMLSGLVSALRRGGLLTLVTCSIEAEENEEVVARVLSSEHDLERFGRPHLALPSSDEADTGSGRWRLFPGDGHDGFTVHVLRRRP